MNPISEIALLAWAVAIIIIVPTSTFAGFNPNWPLKQVLSQDCLRDIFRSKSNMELNGWTVDVTHHNEQQCVSGPGFLKCKDAAGKCGRDTFYGYNLSDEGLIETKGGSVSTEFKGHGKVEISFRNCGSSGTVTMSMNGIVNAAVGPGKQMFAGFEHMPGDVLEIKQHGDAIIKIIKIRCHPF